MCAVQVFSKPGHFRTDFDLLNSVYHRGKSCSRYYYMKWYDAFKRGMGATLPPPLWDGPPIPIWNETHDTLVEQWKVERERREAAEERAALCAMGKAKPGECGEPGKADPNAKETTPPAAASL